MTATLPLRRRRALYTIPCDPVYKFEGKERDTETGSDAFDARYYSNALAAGSAPIGPPYRNRYIRHLSNPQTLNLYARCRGRSRKRPRPRRPLPTNTIFDLVGADSSGTCTPIQTWQSGAIQGGARTQQTQSNRNLRAAVDSGAGYSAVADRVEARRRLGRKAPSTFWDKIRSEQKEQLRRGAVKAPPPGPRQFH